MTKEMWQPATCSKISLCIDNTLQCRAIREKFNAAQEKQTAPDAEEYGRK